MHGCTIPGNVAMMNIYNPKVGEFSKKMGFKLFSRTKETSLSYTDELPTIT